MYMYYSSYALITCLGDVVLAGRGGAGQDEGGAGRGW